MKQQEWYNITATGQIDDRKLELAYCSELLREVCTEPDKYSEDLSRKEIESLKARLADLRAADSIEDLPRGRIFPLENNMQIYEIYESIKISFLQGHNHIPLLETGEIDWNRVSRLRIKNITTKGKTYE